MGLWAITEQGCLGDHPQPAAAQDPPDLVQAKGHPESRPGSPDSQEPKADTVPKLVSGLMVLLLGAAMKRPVRGGVFPPKCICWILTPRTSEDD